MLKMAAPLGGGRAVGISSFSCSCSCSSSKSCFSRQWKPRNSNSNLSMVFPPPFRRCGSVFLLQMACRSVYTRRLLVTCSAVQESSTSSVSVTTSEAKAATPEEAIAPKTKPATKAPSKPLPQLMEEEVIPPLLEILQAQTDISDIELSFQDNRLEGSFLKEGNKYSFWAFFPNGDLTGPKGFSLSSYGSEASTVEPFLVDEKRLTAKLVVFWVEKRLAAQGIIPVWDE